MVKQQRLKSELQDTVLNSLFKPHAEKPCSKACKSTVLILYLVVVLILSKGKPLCELHSIVL